MCSSCNSRDAVVRGLCKSCYNKDYWSRATPRQLQKRRDSVRSSGYAHRRKRALARAVNQIKVASGCVDCGYNNNPVALDFDHVGAKSFGISRAVQNGMRIEKILLEIQKCVVRCANCHRIITQLRHLEN